MALTGKQKRRLRGLGHALEPVVHVGHRGLGPTLLKAVDAELVAHELIKVRRLGECPPKRRELAAALAKELGADVAGEVGHVILLYRAHPERPRIVLDPGTDPEPDSDFVRDADQDEAGE